MAIHHFLLKVCGAKRQVMILILSIMCHSIPMESVWGMRYVLQKKMAKYHFQSIVNPSGNSTLRVHFNDKRMQMVRDKLLDMGCKVEISNLPSFVSINVPQEVSLKVVEDVLTNMQKECDSLAYEHGVVRQNIS